MSARPREPDWDPLAPQVLDDQQHAHDQMRERCPVAWSDERMSAFEPKSRELAAQLLQSYLPQGGDAVPRFTDPYPVQSLCAFLGWPVDDWRQLKLWSSEIERAALRRDPEAGRRATQAFHAYIQSFIDARRREPREDVTTWLLESERVEDVALDDDRKRSILRHDAR